MVKNPCATNPKTTHPSIYDADIVQVAGELLNVCHDVTSFETGVRLLAADSTTRPARKP